MNNDIWKTKIDFMYIGNTPKGFEFKNTNVVSPLSGLSLSNKNKRKSYICNWFTI